MLRAINYFVSIAAILCFPLTIYASYSLHDAQEFQAYDHMKSALNWDTAGGALQQGLDKVHAVCSKAEKSKLKAWCSALLPFISDLRAATTPLEKKLAMKTLKQAYKVGDGGVRGLDSRNCWFVMSILWSIIGIMVMMVGVIVITEIEE